MDSLPLAESRQRFLKIAAGMRKFNEDVDYFSANAPPSDSRRAVALDLRDLIKGAMHSS
jgi:hypothetical protein